MLKVIAKLYLFYLAVSVLVISPALNILVPRFVEEEFGRRLTAEIILFNPLKLSLEARKVVLAEQDGRPFAGLSSADVNLSLASLWSKGIVFDALRVEGFHVDVVQLENGEFNFSDLLAGSESPDSAETETEPGIPGLTAREFYFQSEWLSYTDQARDDPFTTRIDGLAIEVDNLSTVIVAGRPYTLDATSEAGGRLRWEGLISIPDANSSGTLSLSGISLEIASRFLAPWVAFQLDDGRLSIGGEYNVSWADDVSYQIAQGEIEVSSLKIAPQDPESLPETQLDIGALKVSNIEVDSQSTSVLIEDISVSGLQASGWSEGDSVSLADLFSPTSDSADTDEADADVDSESGSEWTISVARSALMDSALAWRSEYTQPERLTINPLNVTVNNLSWPAESASDIKVELAVNDSAQLQVESSLNIGSGDGKANYRLSGLPVDWFNPNLPKAVNASISQGQLESNGAIDLTAFAPVSITTDGKIQDFSMTVQEAENAITAWKSVRWEGLDVRLDQQDIVMKNFFIDGYSGRLHIFADGTINTQRALMAEMEGDEANEAQAAEMEQGSANKPQEAETQQDAANEPQVARTQQDGANESQVEEKPWSYSLPAITITDSALDFMDESLPITFRTVIGNLSGDISGLSSAPESRAKIKLSGTVDGYAPVKLGGTANPLADPPALDLALTFDGMDMAGLTPYSGTYAGYAISRGILNLDLQYKLENNRLDGNNQIVIEQMKLGERIDSEKSLDLPVELALALLTDMSGVIDLTVPVSGDVDDPEFGLGSAIGTALVNIVTKLITAPFSLLASLVSSDEDLERVSFPAGSSTLDERGQLKLTQLGTALTQRPELKLVVAGQIHPESDREYLQLNAFREELLSQGLASEAWEGKNEQWVEAVTAHYQSAGLTPAEPDSEPSAQAMLEQIVAGINVSDDQLQTLASERAVAVKTFLVNNVGLAADRSVIENTELAKMKSRYSGVEMKIDT